MPRRRATKSATTAPRRSVPVAATASGKASPPVTHFWDIPRR